MIHGTVPFSLGFHSHNWTNCTVSGLDWVTFLHSSLYGTVFWMCDDNVLIMGMFSLLLSGAYTEPRLFLLSHPAQQQGGWGEHKKLGGDTAWSQMTKVISLIQGALLCRNSCKKVKEWNAWWSSAFLEMAKHPLPIRSVSKLFACFAFTSVIKLPLPEPQRFLPFSLPVFFPSHPGGSKQASSCVRLASTRTPRNRQRISKYLLVKPFLVTDKGRGTRKQKTI